MVIRKLACALSVLGLIPAATLVELADRDSEPFLVRICSSDNSFYALLPMLSIDSHERRPEHPTLACHGPCVLNRDGSRRRLRDCP